MTMLPIPLESICLECKEHMMRISNTHRFHPECAKIRNKRRQLERYKRLRPIKPVKSDNKYYLKNRVYRLEYQKRYNTEHEQIIKLNQKIRYQKLVREMQLKEERTQKK